MSRPLRAAATTAFFLLTAGCVDEDGQASVSAQDTAPQPEMVDLADLGFNEGTEDTALFGVIEFADFGCIHCADFHAQTYAGLHEEFIGSGQILWKYIPVTLAGFPNSDLAAATIECGGNMGRFAELRDQLYSTREEWLVAERSEALFVEYATRVGLDPDAMRACLATDEPWDRAEMNNTVARQVGVSVTPTFIIAGNPVEGAPPLEVFSEALNQMLDQARAMAADTTGAAADTPEPGTP